MSQSDDGFQSAMDFDIYAGLPTEPLDLNMPFFIDDAGFFAMMSSPFPAAPMEQLSPPFSQQPLLPEAAVSPASSQCALQSPPTVDQALPLAPASDPSGSQHNQNYIVPAPAMERLRVLQTIHPAHTGRPSYSVEFKSQGSRGVRMRDILDDRALLDGSDERVFEATGVRQFRLVIAWPGYDQSGTYIPVQDKKGFITRARLAKLISLHWVRFTEKAAKQRIARDSAQWAIGKRGILFENLWLLSVAPARHNIWLAEVEIQM